MKTKGTQINRDMNNHQAQERKGKSKEKKKKNNVMKSGRKSKGSSSAPPADLLVCFPSRSHLHLVPKPICSPSGPIEPTKRHHPHLSRSTNYRSGLASPSLWARTKAAAGSAEIAEPTSPKVTCAGQIKVRPKTSSSSKNWQSVMEEIERLHNNRNKHKKKPSWFEAIRIRKDILQLPTFLRAVRFDQLRCFSPSHGSNEEDDQENYQENLDGISDGGSGASRTIFSKWFMILQENKNRWFNREEEYCEGILREGDIIGSCDDEGGFVPSAPPPNALLLMRCGSAPAKGLVEEEEEEEEKDQVKKAKFGLEEENKRTEGFILKCYAPDFSKISDNIPKETWFVGETKFPLSRSRSCKR